MTDMTRKLIDAEDAEVEQLRSLVIELNRRLALAESLITSIVHTARGQVEGHATSSINILQRIRQLGEQEIVNAELMEALVNLYYDDDKKAQEQAYSIIFKETASVFRKP
jgi:siderophore synthetase component